jgi:hypothetical protein
MRSLAAVVAGYLVFGVSSAILFGVSGQDPHLLPGAGFLVCSLLYGAAFAGFGGYLAARLAPVRPMLHAAIVAGLIAAIALASMIVEWHAGSVWSELVVLFAVAPAAAVGGWLRTR